MQKSKLQFKIQNLRKKYPRFIYEKYSYKLSKNNLEILFFLKIEPNIYFQPKIVIENVDRSQIKRVRREVLDNLVFHLGLIELLSYWKATCSPEIEIKAGPLDQEQIKWWKNLIMNGMGQFFYENKIDFTKPNFIKIIPINVAGARSNYVAGARSRVLVPVGGGKDSIVTLELLKEAGKEIKCFGLNSTGAAKKIMKIAGCINPIIVRREIDPKLLELNRKGFLNGHTPFSAYLAFLSVLTAIIFDLKYVAFSNERSSNEGNVKYLGKIINHQYSKSFDFEKRFRDYSRKYLTKNIEYFSFLRPLYEIQIVKLFSQYPKYFNAFLSCNEAYKTYSGKKLPTKKWCGKCPKCLFIFASLYPFIEIKKLIKIFGRNLFEDKELLPIMLELFGERKFKPFECVGTKKESLVALYLSYKKCTGPTCEKLPFILRYFERKILPKYLNLKKESKKILESWDSQHNLPKEFEKDIKKSIQT